MNAPGPQYPQQPQPGQPQFQQQGPAQQGPTQQGPTQQYPTQQGPTQQFPPPGQPQGQPYPPQQPFQPQGQPQQFQPQPQAPKKRSVVGRILTAVVGLVVAGLVVYGFNYFTSDAAQTKAGDCASVTGTTTKPEFKTVDCGSAEANYTVGKALSSTTAKCGDNYDEYTETARRGPDSKLCLVPNLEEGACYDLTNTTSMGLAKVACSGASVVKLVKKIKDVEDEAACTELSASPLTYPEPKLTFCFAPAEGA